MFKPALKTSSVRSLASILLLCCAILGTVSTAHALTDSWNVDVQKHTAVQRTYKQGEYIDAYITLRDGYAPLDLSGATAQFLWYTNSTDNIWWTNSATITSPYSGEIQFRWKPSMDTGAPINYYWVGIWMPGSTNPIWRINGTIRLLPSPGFKPNTLALPIRYLDFSTLDYINAPWAYPSDVSAATNNLSAAWQQHYSVIDANLHNLSNYTAAVDRALQTNRVTRLWSSTAYLTLNNSTPIIYGSNVNYYKIEKTPWGDDIYDALLLGPPRELPIYLPVAVADYTTATITAPGGHSWTIIINNSYNNIAGTSIRSSSGGAWYSYMSPNGWPDTIYAQEGAYGNLGISIVSLPSATVLTSQADVDTTISTAITAHQPDKLWSDPSNYIDALGNYHRILPAYTSSNGSEDLQDITWTHSHTDPGTLNQHFTAPGTISDLTYTSLGSTWSLSSSSGRNFAAFQPITDGRYPRTLALQSDDAQPLGLYLIYGTVTNIINRVATTNDLTTAIAASTVNFQDVLLYSIPGTNYYFRWSDLNQTYTVTGVPQ